ncbi:MAG: PEP-CTERM sorting domain-containing protein [Planctomycetaceae bacterium]|nr:PEP-CTERM sorting domain-containing protein [Planctomycetaceae bacterium]
MGAQSQFANAGMFAAAVSTPEPASLAMLGIACLLCGGIQLRRRRRPDSEWIATRC